MTRALAAIVLIAALGASQARAVDLNPGDILVADFSALGGGGAIFRVDPLTGAQTVVSSGGYFSDPTDLLLDGNGDLIVCDFSGKILRIDVATGAQSVIASGGFLVTPTGIASDPTGYLYVADRNNATSTTLADGRIIGVDPTTGTQSLISSGGLLVNTFDIMVAANGDLYVCDTHTAGTGAILRVDPSTGAQSIIASGGHLNAPEQGVIDASGDIITANALSVKLVRINPTTGAQTLISAGGKFVVPNGIAIASNGDFLVGERNGFGGPGGVIRVDPATGAQSVVSSNGSFVDPLGIIALPGSAPSFSVDAATRTVETTRLRMKFNLATPERLDQVVYKDFSYTFNLRGEILSLQQFYGQSIRGLWASQGFTYPGNTPTQDWQVIYQDESHLMVQLDSTTPDQPPVQTVYTFFADRPYYMIDRRILFSQSPQTTSYQVYVPRVYPASSFTTYRYRTPARTVRSGTNYGYGGSNCPFGCNFTDWNREWAQIIDGGVSVTTMYAHRNRQDVSLVIDWDDGSGLSSWSSPLVPNEAHNSDEQFSLLIHFETNVNDLAALDADYAWFNAFLESPPVVTAPADASYPCASQVPPASPEQATATDDLAVVSLTVDETDNGGEGTVASPLILTRTWTAVDPFGNSASASQTITVVDDTAPELSLPDDIAVEVEPGVESCSSARVLVDYGSATATDECGEPTVSVSGVPVDGLFPVGETLLQWSATDPAGNVASATQHVVVSCPFGNISGSATLACNGGVQPAVGVVVQLLDEGEPFLDTTTGPAGSFSFVGVRHGTYTVAIEPPDGYAVTPDTRVVTLDGAELTVDPFGLTCLLSDLVGRVLGECNGQTAGLQGVTVDIYGDDGGGMDVLAATTATDATGNFELTDLALGDYSVSVVLPLGYSGTSAQAVTLDTPDGLVTLGDFELSCQPIASQPRPLGYWKHQVNVYLTGKGKAQESLADLLHYIDEMVVHFNENLVNPVIIYVPVGDNTTDKLQQLQQLLTVNKGGTFLDRAKQELLSLLLNVVSGKIGQTAVVSDDGVTVSQAITYCHALIVDGDPNNDHEAQTICAQINGGESVPVGVIPAGTPNIAYSQRPGPQESSAPLALAIASIVPNPSRSDAAITLALASDAPAELEVLDVTGRVVLRTEVGGRAGVHVVPLRGLGHLTPGVYLVRASQGREFAVKRLAVIR